ncbi:MAG: extracellular solute-binding protein [Treponema sp.]|jgi:multiple sugar transport system substrate-binding protein|nr:extracellular solute-binding protein [Treponema sp.]
MKRIFGLMLALIVLALAPLAAGGRSQQGTAGGGVETITVWTNSAHEKALREQQIARFNNGIGREQGIRIEYTVLGNDYHDTVKIAAQTNEAPDLFRMTGDGVPDYADAGWIVPLEEMPGGPALISKYDGYLITNQHIINGKVYTLPYSLTTYKFIINDDLFKKNNLAYPKTLADIRQAAKVITQNGGGNEFGWVLGLKSNWTASVYCRFLGAPSVGFSGLDPVKLEYRFSEFLPIFDMIMGMIADGSVLPGATDMDADQMRAQFAEGRVAMIPGASFDIGVYTEQFPAKCNWKVIPIPLYTETTIRQPDIADCLNLLCVGSRAKTHPEKAMKVLEYFYSDEWSAEMYEQALYIPFRQEAIAMAKTTPSQNGFAEFASMPSLKLIPSDPEFQLPIEGDLINPTTLGMFSGALGRDTAAIIRDVDRRYNAALSTLPAARRESFRMSKY